MFARKKNDEANARSVVVVPANADDDSHAYTSGPPVAIVQGQSDDLKYKRPSYQLRSLFLTIGTLTSGVGAIIDVQTNPERHFTESLWLLAAITSASLYLVEAFILPCCTDSVLRSLVNRLRSENAFGEHDYFVQLRNTRPQLWMSIECYHYERRTRTVGTGENRRTESYNEKVVTFRKKEQKVFGSWQDKSGTAPQLTHLDPRHFGIFVHIRSSVEYNSPETVQSLEQQGEKFKSEHRNRDRLFEYREWSSRPGMRRVLMLLDKDRTPWYASSFWYVVATVFLCSWLFRMALRSGVMETTFYVVSEIDVESGAFPDIPDATVAFVDNDPVVEENVYEPHLGASETPVNVYTTPVRDDVAEKKAAYDRDDDL